MDHPERMAAFYRAGADVRDQGIFHTSYLEYTTFQREVRAFLETKSN